MKISVFRKALQFLYLLKFGSLSRNWEKQRCVALHYIDIFQGVGAEGSWKIHRVGNFTFPTPQNRGQSDSPPFPRTALKSIQT